MLKISCDGCSRFSIAQMQVALQHPPKPAAQPIAILECEIIELSRNASNDNLLRLIEHHHAADSQTAPQHGETVVNVAQTNAPRDELIQHQLAVEIGLRQHGKVPGRTRVTVARAANSF